MDDAQSSRYDAVLGQFVAVGSEDLGESVMLLRNAGAPTDAVAGTGYGTSAEGTYYANVTAPTAFTFYRNDGHELNPQWTNLGAGLFNTQPGAPVNGTTDGATGQGYYDGVNDKYYVCTNGTTDVWLNVDATTVRAAATAPVNHTTGTGELFAAKGSLLIDNSTPALYINTGTLALPAWTAIA